MLQLNIQKMLLTKGIDQPFKWLKHIGIKHYMAHRLMKGDVKVFPLDVIELICRNAYCTPNDILVWVPDAPEMDVPDHPMQKLKPKTTNLVVDRLKTLTPEDLDKVNGFIDELKKG